MSFQKIVSAFFKEDPLYKELKQTNMLTNSLSHPFLKESLKFYEEWLMKGGEQSLIKSLLKILEEKGQIMKKIKIMSFWIEMFKLTKYDLSDIIMSKKIKIFTKNAQLKDQTNTQVLTQSNLEDYLLAKVLIPLYNYFMKLSVNEELFKLCVIGKVPEDDIFRRGSKIKFIWIFKLYNLISPLIPIVSTCATILEQFPDLEGLRDIAYQCYEDILTMNDFIIEALEEGAEDNFLLMPYFEMLQFYETMQEQAQTESKIDQIFASMKKSSSNAKNPSPTYKRECKKPRIMKIDPQIKQQIEAQTLRVKLISNSMKNPKKDHTRLQTEYNQKLEGINSRFLKTEGNDDSAGEQHRKAFLEKFRNLD